ncbi:MAG: tRNA (adenosine(37)-N6)-dimethylallyltransferase MiaA [Chakrabartia sp.]
MNTGDSPSKPMVALIAGPTASGKSAIALALAKMRPATIINADASQVYRDLRVVSARPSVEDETQAPHAAFGFIDGAEACSAARWAEAAKAAIADSVSLGRLPILVGGTGLYIRTLLDGIAPIPDIDPTVRLQVRALSGAMAYQLLCAEDREAAQRLSPNDSSRIARALEVVRSTEKPMHHWQTQTVGGIGQSISLCPMILLPPRDWLFDRCDTRFSAMLENGGMDEVRALLDRNLDPALPVMRAIGVREIAGIIADPKSREVGESAAQLATRQYAKRQYTWFRNQMPTNWLRVETMLNSENVNDLAIILRNRSLT